MKNFFSTAIALIVFFSFFGCEEGLKDDWNKTIVAPRFTTDNPAAVINSEGRLISNCDINAVIYSSDDEADIYYSLDNGGTWSRYFAPIPVKGNGSDIQIIAYAEIDRHGESERTEARFVVNYDRDIDPETIADNPRNQVYAPEFVTDNPANTNFTADSVTCYGKMSAVISTRTAGAVIYFSFDELIWLPYVDKIPLEGHGSDITIFAKAIKDGMLDSDVTNRQYIVDYTGSDWQVAAPEFGTDDPLNTQYSNSTFVCKDDMNAVISTVTEGSVIKYSFDQVNWWRYIEEIPIVGMDTDFTIYAKASKAGMVDSGIVSRRFRMGYVFTSAPVFQLAYQQNILKSSDPVVAEIVNKTRNLSNGGTFTLSGMLFCSEEAHAYFMYNPGLTITTATSGAEILVEIFEYNLSSNTDNDHLFSHKPLARYSSPLQLYDKNGSGFIFMNNNIYGTKYVIKATARKDGCRDSTSTTTFQVYGVYAP